MKNKQDISKTH